MCRRSSYYAVVAAVALLGACDVFPSATVAPLPTRRVAFLDFSGTVSAAERPSLVAAVRALGSSCRDSLWYPGEYSQLVLLPIHARTASATPIFVQRFNGFELERDTCARQQREFLARVDSLGGLTVPQELRGSSSIVATIRVAEQYFETDTASSVRELHYFSDMLEDTPAQRSLSVAVLDRPGKVREADELARRVAESNGITATTLPGVRVFVRLPGTMYGSRHQLGPEQAAALEKFWRKLFSLAGAEVVAWGRFDHTQ